jgi:hypothetical protein
MSELDDGRSDFGQGFTYCLGKFLEHAERPRLVKAEKEWMWFAGATDHLRDLELPDNLPEEIAAQVDALENFCRLRQNPEFESTYDDVDKALGMAEGILAAVDRWLGVVVKLSRWA